MNRKIVENFIDKYKSKSYHRDIDPIFLLFVGLGKETSKSFLPHTQVNLLIL